jgi:predicted ATPase/DNA-binding winged helix-turn-helix (wHTH) protein
MQTKVNSPSAELVTEPPLSSQGCAFGHCEVWPERREVRRDGKVILVGNRGFDILMALAMRAGEVVSKDELIAFVWQGRIVEENSIESQVSLLRRALGEDRDAIRTVQGQGYQLVAKTVEVAVPAVSNLVVKLPAKHFCLIDRDIALDELEDMAIESRLVTLVGPGGVGKSKLAIELGHRLSSGFHDRVCIVDLASISNPGSVVPSVASALGFFSVEEVVVMAQVAELLDAKSTLLVLDNCEHVIDACASTADFLLRACQFLQIVATSREPLRVEGERVFRVAPLTTPDAHIDDNATLMSSGAMRLLEAELSRSQIAGAMEPASVPLKAKICRHLDGMPLAIGLAAAWIEKSGVSGVAQQLDHFFDETGAGSCYSLPRQQMLEPLLDCRINLLPRAEQSVLFQLSIFAGEFTMGSAITVLKSYELAAETIIDCVVKLVDKSLIVPDFAGAEPRYKLLGITRLFAKQKLREHPAFSHVSRRHAEHFLDRMPAIEADAEEESSPKGVHEDICAAIRWCFSDNGDVRVGLDLTAAAAPYLVKHLCFTERITHVSRARPSLAAAKVSAKVGLESSTSCVDGPDYLARSHNAFGY